MDDDWATDDWNMDDDWATDDWNMDDDSASDDDSFNGPDLYYCLDKDQSYLFKIYDSFGDGLSVGGGYAKLYLNGRLVGEVNGTGSWFEEQRKFTVEDASPTPAPTDYPTPAPTEKIICKDDKKAEINGKKKGCKKYVRKGKAKKIKKKCKQTDAGTGLKIHMICLQTCGEVGVGQCKNLV